MKKSVIFSAAALMLCGIASQAKNVEDIRIYLNPGHGSWTANDRPMNTLREVDGKLTVVNPKSGENRPDTTAFYETNTNIRKVLAMVDKLESYGFKIDRTKNQTNSNKYRVGAALDLSNNICMSHVMAGPWPKDDGYDSDVCNRSLSDIAYEAQSNNFDIFCSVHSNAHSKDAGNTNYLVFIYRGTSEEGGDRSPGSIEICKAGWPHAFSIEHHHWTHRKSSNLDQGVLGDVTFYHEDYYSSRTGVSGYLGALRHTVPGYLTEGYFHTYQPSRCRAMNFDACRLEGYMYARGIADYVGVAKENTGDIYGIVRDIRRQFNHELYTPFSNTTDVYLPLNGVTVRLFDESGNEVRSCVTDNHYNGSFVFMDLPVGTYTATFEHPDYKPADESQPTTYVVEAAKAIYPEVFLASSKYTPPVGDFYDYPDVKAGEELGAIESIAMEMDYSEAIGQLEGKNVKRTLARDKMVYILAHDADLNPTILLYDTESKSVARTLSLEGTRGDFSKVGDIALSSDGCLMALNAGTQERGKSSMVRGYKWKLGEDGYADGEPEEVLAMNDAAQYDTAEYGKTIAFGGLNGEGKYYFSCMTTASNHRVRLGVLNFVEGFYSEPTYANLERVKVGSGNLTDTSLGDFRLYVSPLNDNSLIVTSTKLPPFELALKDTNGGIPTVTSVANIEETGNAFNASFFKLGGHTYMVGHLNDTDIYMWDITEGLDKAQRIDLGLSASTPNGAPAWSQPEGYNRALSSWATVDDKGAVKVHVVLSREGNITKFTGSLSTDGVENVNVNKADRNAPVEYYNLQGIRVNEPTNGVYIMRQGNNVTKIVR